MNKGVRLASGEYVCFLNAGDSFASTDTVTRMFVPRPETELIWGDCIIESAKGEEYDRASVVIPRLHRQMTVSHQSMFTRREALLRRPYDISYRIAADYDFLCERILAGASWEYRPLPGEQDQRQRRLCPGLSHQHPGEKADRPFLVSRQACRHSVSSLHPFSQVTKYLEDWMPGVVPFHILCSGISVKEKE